MRKLIPGATDKSYGIHVARLAGIPRKVTERADAILADTLSRDTSGGAKTRRYTQLLLVDDSQTARTASPVPDPVITELAGLDPDSMTPMQALAKLAELKGRAGKSGTSPEEGGA